MYYDTPNVDTHIYLLKNVLKIYTNMLEQYVGALGPHQEATFFS